MSHPDAERWDRRYLEAPERPARSPDPFVTECLPRLPRGRALDLAAGEGRHALLLAREGWRVDALDVSRVALGRLAAAARSEGLPVRCAVVDLERWSPPFEAFDLVLLVDFLWRPLLDGLGRDLRPGAAALLALPTVDRPASLPALRRDYLLERGELRSRLRGLDLAIDRERSGRAEVLAIRAPGRAQ